MTDRYAHMYNYRSERTNSTQLINFDPLSAQKLLQPQDFCNKIFYFILSVEYTIKILYEDCKILCVCFKVFLSIYIYKFLVEKKRRGES